MNAIQTAAHAFKAFHVPGKPLLLANVYDAASARLVASLPRCNALATTSFAIARLNGTEDADLTLETHLSSLREIASVANETGKPLTVDFQDGYGDKLEEGIQKMIEMGVVGINLEDADQKTAVVMDEETATQRVKRALAAATNAGVPDFVVNARSDTYLRGGTLDEAIRRGKLYLHAGATSVYILGGGPNGSTTEEVKKMVAALDGRINIGLRLPKPGMEAVSLTSDDLAKLGVSRISVGPQIYLAAAEATKIASQKVFGLS